MVRVDTDTDDTDTDDTDTDDTIINDALALVSELPSVRSNPALLQIAQDICSDWSSWYEHDEPISGRDAADFLLSCISGKMYDVADSRSHEKHERQAVHYLTEQWYSAAARELNERVRP